MKKMIVFLAMLLCGAFCSADAQLTGAWKNVSGDVTTVLLFGDGYFASASYTPQAFKATRGGPFEVVGNKLAVRLEFNTMEKELTIESTPFRFNNGVLTLGKEKYQRLDDGKAPLAGVWKITGRMEEGKINQIHQTGTRKTLKMLTGTRFQWFAIDPNGNKFSGTGGGTYTFKDGKYTENIEFFSRDASRVGASLTFDDHIADGQWHHTGLSSRGDKIYEIWGHDNSGGK